MKKIALLPVILFVFSCACKKNAPVALSQNYTLENGCPSEGDCRIEVMKDKSLDVKKDGTGATYFNTIATPGKTVVQYTYTKKTDPRLQDAGYVEKVIFEINSDETGFSYKDKELQTTKMLFGVVCFCRDKSGFYPVQQGSLDYSNKKLTIELPEIVDSQKLNSISVAFE